MKLNEALERLNQLLPLKQRQSQLDSSLTALHRGILRSFAECGQPLSREQAAAHLGDAGVDAALLRLAQDDLIVLSPDRRDISGAYPFTTEQRVHRVTINGHLVHAMCALDALSVAPMFATGTRVESRCQVSGDPIKIDMQGSDLLGVTPEQPCVGIRWQSTSGCAADSLCMEMVFLRDAATATTWQDGEQDTISVFDLPTAVAFAAAFFRPLLQ